MTFTESEMESSYLQTVKQRFSIVAERADQLRLNCPYRFYKMSPEAVDSWLDKHFVPTELGWTEEKILELEGVLSRIIPNDYRIFLSFLGNLHHQLFGYDCDLRNPSDYLDIRLDCLEYDEQWGEAVNDASFYEMTQTGIFLNTLGGFAVWYLSPMPDSPSSIKFWDEGERDEPASIKLEARLVEAIECRMSGFERRIQLYLDLGGSLVYGKGGELPVGCELDNELLTIPHDHFMVELSQSQKDKIQAVFSQTEL